MGRWTQYDEASLKSLVFIPYIVSTMVHKDSYRLPEGVQRTAETGQYTFSNNTIAANEDKDAPRPMYTEALGEPLHPSFTPGFI